MATDMQSFVNEMLSHGTHAAPAARDGQATVQGSAPSRTFNSLLERAEAHQATTTPEPASVRAGSKAALSARSSRHSKLEADSQGADRSTEAVRQERTAGPHEKSCVKADCVSDTELEGFRDEDDIDQAEDQSTQRLESLVAASLLLAPTGVQTDIHTTAEPDSELGTSADGAGKVAPTDATGSPETLSAQLVAVNPSIQTSDEALVGHAAPAQTQNSDRKQSSESEQLGEGAIDLSAFARSESHGEVPEESADRTDAAVTDPTIDPVKVTTVAAAVTTRTTEAGITKQAEGDRVDRKAFPEELAQDTPVSVEQASATTGKFLENESESLSNSSTDPDRSMPNQAMSNGPTDRALFLERMNGLNPAALSSNEKAVGLNEMGAPAEVLRAAESERWNELRGASPVAHSVMLDLDPLDMGPLRVRVMISDQTVHAHIRTEHGELGQGLLQQGQSLESSLRTTGLEMGMLRVTVDQQQGRSENAWMFQQQHQNRPTVSPGQRSTTGEDERSARGESGEYTSERVSIFA